MHTKQNVKILNEINFFETKNLRMKTNRSVAVITTHCCGNSKKKFYAENQIMCMETHSVSVICLHRQQRAHRRHD